MIWNHSAAPGAGHPRDESASRQPGFRWDAWHPRNLSSAEPTPSLATRLTRALRLRCAVSGNSRFLAVFAILVPTHNLLVLGSSPSGPIVGVGFQPAVFFYPTLQSVCKNGTFGERIVHSARIHRRTWRNPSAFPLHSPCIPRAFACLLRRNIWRSKSRATL